MSCSNWIRARREADRSGRRALRAVLPRHLFIKRLRRHVKTARPDERAELWVDRHPGKQPWIAKRRKHASPLTLIERELACDAILEREPQAMLTHDLDSKYMNELVLHCGHHASLGQGLDCDKGLVRSRTRPVRQELGFVESNPFHHQAQCTGGQLTSKQGAIARNRRSVAGVLCMEMGGWVVALSPIHRDYNSMEAADPWHLRHRTRHLRRRPRSRLVGCCAR